MSGPRRWLRWAVTRIVRPIAGVLHDELEAVADERRATAHRRLRHRLQSCGEGVRFGRRVLITDPKSASLGSRVRLDDDVRLETEGGLTLGDGTFVGRGATIRTTRRELRDGGPPRRPVFVGRDAWIGPGATIEAGSRIADGAVVGAGVVVEGTLEPGAIAASPPHVIRGRVSLPATSDRRRAGAETRFVFVPSTGRSGTTTMARLLSFHPDIVCRHEPRPQLIRLSTELAHGIVDEDAAQMELDALYRQTATYSAPIYGESDHRLFNLVGLLTEMLPSARILWLVRDGRRVVASTIARGWYSEEPPSDLWGEYRLLGDRCGDIPAEQWAAMTQFERNCWYWSYVNRILDRQVELLQPDRWRRVRLEDLDTVTPSLFEFLEVPSLEPDVPRENLTRGELIRPIAWSPEERRAFERICGDLMDRWYAGWRETW